MLRPAQFLFAGRSGAGIPGTSDFRLARARRNSRSPADSPAPAEIMAAGDPIGTIPLRRDQFFCGGDGRLRGDLVLRVIRVDGRGVRHERVAFRFVRRCADTTGRRGLQQPASAAPARPFQRRRRMARQAQCVALRRRAALLGNLVARIER